MSPVIRQVDVHGFHGAHGMCLASVSNPQVAVRGAGYSETVRWKAAPLALNPTLFTFRIDFNYAEGSPFAWTTKNSAGGVVDGTPNKGGAIPENYRYTLTVFMKGKGSSSPACTVVIDPDVIVDDNTPPPQRLLAVRSKNRAPRRRRPRRKVIRKR